MDGEWGRSYIGSVARSGASGGGSTVGAETRVDNDLVKVRGFLEGDKTGVW